MAESATSNESTTPVSAHPVSPILNEVASSDKPQTSQTGYTMRDWRSRLLGNGSMTVAEWVMALATVFMVVTTVCMVKVARDSRVSIEKQTSTNKQIQEQDAYLQFKRRFAEFYQNIPERKKRREMIERYYEIKDHPFGEPRTSENENTHSAIVAYWNHAFDEWYYFKGSGESPHWQNIFGPATAASLDMNQADRIIGYYAVFLRTGRERILASR